MKMNMDHHTWEAFIENCMFPYLCFLPVPDAEPCYEIHDQRVVDDGMIEQIEWMDHHPIPNRMRDMKLRTSCMVNKCCGDTVICPYV